MIRAMVNHSCDDDDDDVDDDDNDDDDDDDQGHGEPQLWPQLPRVLGPARGQTGARDKEESGHRWDIVLY